MKALIAAQFVLLLTGLVVMSVGAWKREAGKPPSVSDDPAVTEAERRKGRLVFRIGQASLILSGLAGALHYLLK